MADKAIIHEQSNSVKHTPICCFRVIEQQEVTFAENGISFSLGTTADRITNEFEHDSFIMMWAAPFIERVLEQCPHAICGSVVYKNTINDYEFHVPPHIKDRVEQLFRKDEQYSWQKEYRIVLPSSNSSPIFLELGSIEDIAISGKISDLKI